MWTIKTSLSILINFNYFLVNLLKSFEICNFRSFFLLMSLFYSDFVWNIIKIS
jgi:hypothetical protein